MSEATEPPCVYHGYKWDGHKWKWLSREVDECVRCCMERTFEPDVHYYFRGWSYEEKERT